MFLNALAHSKLATTIPKDLPQSYFFLHSEMESLFEVTSKFDFQVGYLKIFHISYPILSAEGTTIGQISMK